MKSSVLLVFLGVFATSCQFFNKSANDKKVARVGENYLFLSTITDLTKEATTEDSLSIATNYIENWIKEQLMILKASQNLSEEQLNFEQQLNDYKNSLIIYEYQNELVRQKLDTNVTPNQVSEYFQANSQNFILKEDVVRYQLIKAKSSAPQQDSLSLWMITDESESEQKLKDYCLQFALKCQHQKDAWLAFSQLVEMTSHHPDFNPVSLQELGYKAYLDSINAIHVNIIEVKKAGELAPISYVSSQIEDIIINKRKLDLLAKVRNEIFEEGTLNRKYEVYH